MEDLDYIDSYFNGELSADETGEFEQKINDDPGFAEEVADYLSILKVTREQMQEDKRKRFREIYQQGKPGKTVHLIRRIGSSVAVAALVAGIIFGWYRFNKPLSADQLADRYIHEKLQSLPLKMTPNSSKMQIGINLFNDDSLYQALEYFQSSVQADTNNFEAKEYAGIAALRLQKYDMALDYFKQLQTYTTLFDQPALLYEALTLMKRNRPGDKQQAKQLLQQIVDQELSNKDAAKELINQW